MTLKWLYLYLYYQRSCCNVMFSGASVCQSVILSTRSTFDHYPWCIGLHYTVTPPKPKPWPYQDMRPYCRGTSLPYSPGHEISLKRDPPGLLYMGPQWLGTPLTPALQTPCPPPRGWHLVGTDAYMVGKRLVCILLECFPVFRSIWIPQVVRTNWKGHHLSFSQTRRNWRYWHQSPS